VFAPERATQHITLSLSGDGSLATTTCGEAARFVKLVPPEGPFADISGSYANAATGITARIETMGAALRLSMGTDAGRHRMSLTWIDRDLLVGLPEAASPSRSWPPSWSCTLQIVPEGLLLTTDRTKRLVLKR